MEATTDKIVKLAVKELTTNHKLQLADGSWKNIVSIANGMYSGSKLITYQNGAWSCLLNNDIVEAIYIEPVIN